MMTQKQLETRLYYAKLIRDAAFISFIVSIFWYSF